ncbi:MAG: hypothetical protein WC733_09870 [Methylophilus sp.]|jgi:hypothetical protein
MYLSGIDVTNTSSTPLYGLGDIGANVTSAGTKIYMYVKASGAITGAGYVVDIDGSAFTAVMSTTTTTAPGTGAGKSVGVAPLAFADTYYGWVQVYGAAVVRVAASAAAYTILNSTATAGQLDDDATAGAEVIDGIVLDVANGGSAGTAAGWLNWPAVGRTL